MECDYDQEGRRNQKQEFFHLGIVTQASSEGRVSGPEINSAWKANLWELLRFILRREVIGGM